MSDSSKIGKAVAKAIMEGVTSYHDATGMEAVSNALNNNSVHISSAEHHVPSSEEKAFRKAEALKNDERKEDAKKLMEAESYRKGEPQAQSDPPAQDKGSKIQANVEAEKQPEKTESPAPKNENDQSHK